MLPDEPPRPQTPKLVGTILGPYPAGDLDERLDDLVEEMCEAPGREQPKFARAVLAIDPENIDALLVLAEHSKIQAECLALLREAVRIGNETWKPALKGQMRVNWWWQIGTRPFMRAIMCYGQTLAHAGNTKAAATCFKTLLTLQPSDSLGARFELAALETRPSEPGMNH